MQMITSDAKLENEILHVLQDYKRNREGADDEEISGDVITSAPEINAIREVRKIIMRENLKAILNELGYQIGYIELLIRLSVFISIDHIQNKLVDERDFLIKLQSVGESATVSTESTGLN